MRDLYLPLDIYLSMIEKYLSELAGLNHKQNIFFHGLNVFKCFIFT